MLSSDLKFYHGTTKSSWDVIQQEGFFKPKETKKIGKYWITKGVYFVCENPYYALWYAKFKCFLDYVNKKKQGIPCDAVVEQPVVIEVEGLLSMADLQIHLLTSYGMRILMQSHRMFLMHYRRNRRKYGQHDNLDAHALMQLKNIYRGKNVCILAAFQEGESVQRIMLDNIFLEEYMKERSGFCIGDNISACFLDWVPLAAVSSYSILTENDILKRDAYSGTPSLYEKMCDGLNCKLCEMEYYKELLWYYHGEL